MRTAVAFLFLLVAGAYAQTAGMWGTQYACPAASATAQYTFSLNTIAGGSSWSGNLAVSIQCSGSAGGMWSIADYTAASGWATLAANGFNAVSLSGAVSATSSVGFTITATAGTTVTATIETPDVTVAVAFSTIIATITGQVTAQAGFVQIDASGKAQFVVPAQLVNVGIAGKALQATFTVTGGASSSTSQNFVLSIINLNIPNVAFSVKFPVTANANQTFVFMDAKTSVQLLAAASSQLDCTMTTTSTTPPPSTQGNYLKVFLQFDTYDQSGAATSYNGQATISYKYSAADLTAAGVTNAQAANLKFAFYDTSSMSWTTPSSGCNVDTQAMVVSQTTTHFSQWSVYASNAANALNANFLLVALAALISYVLA